MGAICFGYMTLTDDVAPQSRDAAAFYFTAVLLSTKTQVSA